MTNIRKAVGNTLVTVVYDEAAVPRGILGVLLEEDGCVDRAVSWVREDAMERGMDGDPYEPECVNVYIESDTKPRYRVTKRDAQGRVELEFDDRYSAVGSVCYSVDHTCEGSDTCDCPEMHVVVGGGYLLRLTDREPMPPLEVRPRPAST